MFTTRKAVSKRTPYSAQMLRKLQDNSSNNSGECTVAAIQAIKPALHTKRNTQSTTKLGCSNASKTQTKHGSRERETYLASATLVGVLLHCQLWQEGVVSVRHYLGIGAAATSVGRNSCKDHFVQLFCRKATRDHTTSGWHHNPLKTRCKHHLERKVNERVLKSTL